MKQKPSRREPNEFTSLQIVQALFDRSMAGVFAHRSPSGIMTIRYPKSCPWTLTLGLAVRLQNESARASLDPSRFPAIDRIVASYKDWPIIDLELATTDHLLAALYRITKGDWVLGLFRPKRYMGHWSGICWNGSPLCCAGLSSVIVETIQSRIFLNRLKATKRKYILAEDLKKLFLDVWCHAETKTPSKTFMAGVVQMAEHLVRQAGHDGLPGDDLESFVRIDWEQEK